uniref:Uncharacterized protein n=1 Tax=Ciona savignyi TaxID=51511 RepID=H2YTW8_CIOSA
MDDLPAQQYRAPHDLHYMDRTFAMVPGTENVSFPQPSQFQEIPTSGKMQNPDEVQPKQFANEVNFNHSAPNPSRVRTLSNNSEKSFSSLMGSEHGFQHELIREHQRPAFYEVIGLAGCGGSPTEPHSGPHSTEAPGKAQGVPGLTHALPVRRTK